MFDTYVDAAEAEDGPTLRRFLEHGLGAYKAPSPRSVSLTEEPRDSATL